MDDGQTAQIRRFNRLVTRRAGALDDSYLSRGRPLSEARLLFEIGTRGADIVGLRGRLGLDSGYLSRLLRSLEAQGLATVRKRSGDARRRHVVLSAEGEAEVAVYDRLSDDLATAMVAGLDAGERNRLVGAMAEIERLLGSQAVELRAEEPASPDAAWCLDQYFRELAERFEAGFDPVRGDHAGDLEMAPPSGLFLVARIDGRPVGCGGLKWRDDVTGEIKRMWIARDARGCGIARKLLRDLEARARRSGLAALRLDTNRALPEAQALYRSEGYEEVEAFSDHPYAHFWFGKRL